MKTATAVVAALALALGIVAVTLYSGTRPASQPHDSDSHTHLEAIRKIVDPPEPAPIFSLIDQRGNKQGLDNWSGKIVLLSFVYTRCPDICPTTALAFRVVQDNLHNKIPDNLVLAFVTVDPEYDTPERLDAWVNQFGLEAVALTGTFVEVENVWNEYGVVVVENDGGVVHTGKTVLIDHDGKIRFEYLGVPTAQQLLPDILLLLDMLS